MKLVEFSPQPTVEKALEIVEALRQDVVAGKIIGFFIVGVSSDDNTYAYVGTTRPVSRLRMGGAMQHALHCFNHGEDED